MRRKSIKGVHFYFRDSCVLPVCGPKEKRVSLICSFIYERFWSYCRYWQSRHRDFPMKQGQYQMKTRRILPYLTAHTSAA